MAGRRSNPLALATLVYLMERERHPYEIAADMRIRHQHECIKLNYGSLYSVIATLERQGLIEARETVRAGRRPERTIYAITDAGRREAVDWLTHLLSTPVKEYLQFEAALSLVAALPPEEVAELLHQRVAVLDEIIKVLGAHLGTREQLDLPRLFVLEAEYQQRLLVAEREFVAELVAELEAGTLDGLEQWRAWSSAPSDEVAPETGREVTGSDGHPDERASERDAPAR